jgi:hypothetical protein
VATYQCCQNGCDLKYLKVLLTLLCDRIESLPSSIHQLTNLRELEILGAFEGVAHGLGCAPGFLFLCLASSPPPSARSTRAKSPLSAWLPWYAIFHRSARARLSTALGGRFSGALRWRWVALAGLRGRRETSSRPSPSRKPWPIKASAGASSLLLPSLP